MSCGGDQPPLLDFTDVKFTKITVKGDVDTASTVTFLKIDESDGADIDVDPLKFELLLNLDGVDLIEDPGNSNQVINTVKINTLNDLEVSPTDEDKGLVEIGFTLNFRETTE